MTWSSSLSKIHTSNDRNQSDHLRTHFYGRMAARDVDWRREMRLTLHSPPMPFWTATITPKGLQWVSTTSRAEEHSGHAVCTKRRRKRRAVQLANDPSMWPFANVYNGPAKKWVLVILIFILCAPMASACRRDYVKWLLSMPNHIMTHISSLLFERGMTLWPPSYKRNMIVFL